MTRTRHAHQITAASLSILQHDAYERYKETLLMGENVLDFTDWCGKMRAEQPQFKMELIIFQIIESIKTGNFLSYRESLSMFIPWVFSFNQKRTQSYTKSLLQEGLLHKTNHPFSAMALDQAHEQANANVKSDGGAVGLTNNPKARKCQEWWQSLKMTPFLVQVQD